jgi:hypothetical protein
MTFLYLVPTGMNDPEHPEWGSWAGRYGLNPELPGRRYHWANQVDAWEGTTHRDNVLKRWAAHLQNDFKARLDWCVSDLAAANHPPVPRVRGEERRMVAAGDAVLLEAAESSDPDRNGLRFEWIVYAEAGGYDGPAIAIEGASSPRARFTAPRVEKAQAIHLILAVSDDGAPPLTRYRRVIVTVAPGSG